MSETCCSIRSRASCSSAGDEERNYGSCQTSSDPKIAVSSWGWHETEAFTNDDGDYDGSSCVVACLTGTTHADYMLPRCVYYGQGVPMNATVGAAIAAGRVDGRTACAEECGGGAVGDYNDGTYDSEFYSCCACGSNKCFNIAKPAVHSTAFVYHDKNYKKKKQNIEGIIATILILVIICCCCCAGCIGLAVAIQQRRRNAIPHHTHAGFTPGFTGAVPAPVPQSGPISYGNAPIQGTVIQGTVVGHTPTAPPYAGHNKF